MKVRILVSKAGLADPRYQLPEFSFQPGDIATVHPDLAEAWIAAGHAEAEILPAASQDVKPSGRKAKR